MTEEIQAIRLVTNTIPLFQCSSQCLSQLHCLKSFCIIHSYHSQTASVFNTTNNVIQGMSLDPHSSSSRHVSQFHKIKAVLKNTPKPRKTMYNKLNWWDCKGTWRELGKPGESTFIFYKFATLLHSCGFYCFLITLPKNF